MNEVHSLCLVTVYILFKYFCILIDKTTNACLPGASFLTLWITISATVLEVDESQNGRKWSLRYLISFYWWRRLRVILDGKETRDKCLINSPLIIGSISGSQSPATPFMNHVNPPGYLSRFKDLSIIEHPHASKRHCRLFIRNYIGVFLSWGSIQSLSSLNSLSAQFFFFDSQVQNIIKKAN